MLVWPNPPWWFPLPLFLGDPETRIRFDVASSSDGQPIFIFNQRTIDYARTSFFGFIFEELLSAKPERINIVWQIVQEKVAKVKVDSITYGVCPTGYKVMVPAQPLLVGHYYRFDGMPDIVEKVGPSQFRVISIEQYRQDIKDGKALIR
jgi:hypothetical protein